MSAWKSPGDGPDWNKMIPVAGVAAGLLILCWLLLGRSDDSRIASSGFNSGGSSPVVAVPAGAALTERRSETGLSFVRSGLDEAPPSSETPQVPAGSAPAAEGAPQTASTSAAPAAASAPAAAEAPPSAAELAAVGVRSDPSSLNKLGAEKGLLSRVVDKALEHPTVLRMLLNNKTLVDAYFSRGLVQKNCSSGSALKSYLMNGGDPQGVSEEMTIARSLLQHPDAAAVAVGTEFGSRLMACPSVDALSKDPGAVMQVITSNPGALGLVGDPNAMKALASNPQAASLLSGVQSSIGGGAGR
jgi:hypothetical protein